MYRQIKKPSTATEKNLYFSDGQTQNPRVFISALDTVTTLITMLLSACCFDGAVMCYACYFQHLGFVKLYFLSCYL